MCWSKSFRFLESRPYAVTKNRQSLSCTVLFAVYKAIGENEGRSRPQFNYPAQTITVMISIYTARSHEKRLEGKSGLSALRSAKEAFWLQLGPFMLKYS